MTQMVESRRTVDVLFAHDSGRVLISNTTVPP